MSLGTDGAQVESPQLQFTFVSPRDIFAPSVRQENFTIAAPGRLSIFFPANPESDVVGYEIYRSPDPDLPKERWTKVTPAPLPKTTFVDENVESGKRYYYFIKAIDQAGNVSPASEVESESVP